MAHRQRCSADYKREAVAMLDAPGISVSQIAADLGIGVTVLGLWRRELRQGHDQAFRGDGRPRDQELAQLRWPLARVIKGWDFFARSGRILRERIAMKYRMNQRCRDAFPIRLMCRCVRVSPSGPRVRKLMKIFGYLNGPVCCMPTMTASWEAHASGMTCAMPESDVASTGWCA